MQIIGIKRHSNYVTSQTINDVKYIFLMTFSIKANCFSQTMLILMHRRVISQRLVKV